MSLQLSFLRHEQQLRNIVQGNKIDLRLRPPIDSYSLMDYDKMEDIFVSSYIKAMRRIQAWKLRNSATTRAVDADAANKNVKATTDKLQPLKVSRSSMGMLNKASRESYLDLQYLHAETNSRSSISAPLSPLDHIRDANNCSAPKLKLKRSRSSQADTPFLLRRTSFSEY